MKYNDPKKLTAKAIVFNPNKFYAGRALELEGIDGEGDPVSGTFLIQKVRMDRITLINSNGNEMELGVEYFVDELDEGETYVAQMKVEFLGS